MVVRTVPALRRAVEALRTRKAAVALVPTMGALHDGHVSLVRLADAGRKSHRLIVNPTQFAPTEDFARIRVPRRTSPNSPPCYRRLDLNPDVKAMYPTASPPVAIGRLRPPPGLRIVSGRIFGGVATVVGKLFTQAGRMGDSARRISAIAGGDADGHRSRPGQGDRSRTVRNAIYGDVLAQRYLSPENGGRRRPTAP
jgi:pantothenate synthetase